MAHGFWVARPESSKGVCRGNIASNHALRRLRRATQHVSLVLQRLLDSASLHSTTASRPHDRSFFLSSPDFFAGGGGEYFGTAVPLGWFVTVVPTGIGCGKGPTGAAVPLVFPDVVGFPAIVPG